MSATPGDLAEVQDLLDRSFAAASSHLTSIMEPGRRLSAERLVAELPCPAVLNIATVTARGEPRVSAVDGHFLGSHWYFSTAAASPKARQLRARPAISASYTPRDGFGVFCHGQAVELPPGDEQQMVDDHFADVYGESPSTWGIALYWARIDAEWLVAFAMTPEEQAEAERKKAERTGG